MEPTYLKLGEDIFSNNVDIVRYSSFYSIIIFFLTTIVGNLFNASATIYIVGGTLISVYLYLIGKLIYDEPTAIIALIISIIFPSITIAVAGYSHTVILATAFELMAIYYFLLFLKDENLMLVLLVAPLTMLAIMTRAETLVIIFPFMLVVCMLKSYEGVGSLNFKEDGFQKEQEIISGETSIALNTRFKLRAILNKKNKPMFIFLLLMASSIISFSLAHKSFIEKLSHDKTYAGIFADKTYSYITFVTKYSLRELGSYGSSEEILATSVPFIGTPESNNYSILTAILKYPSQFILTSLYNAKELLDNLAHPLFSPFYFYIFIGLIFSKNNPKFEIKIASLVALLAFFHVIPLLVFHIEIRYMQAISILLILLISRGLFYVGNKKLVSFIILPPTLFVYLAYMYKLSRPSFSMCGY